ncbi:MAG: autoinducer binding domain-containing protein [Pikeienuella sp.]|uniref:autoinducer binding domain-containing protein n=1 Tax=Pikeienuella sp. TaxID=2831957 RepID=UPI00391A7FF2
MLDHDLQHSSAERARADSHVAASAEPKSLSGLVDVLEGLSDDEDVARHATAAARIRDHLDVKHLSFCVILDPPGRSLADRALTTYDQQWVDRYVAKKYWMCDPVLRAFMDGREEIWWNADAEPEPGTPPFVASFVKDARRFGAGATGLARYVRTEARGAYVLTLTSDEHPACFADRMRSRSREIDLVASFFTDELAGPAEPAAGLSAFSEDEVLLLRLLSSGRALEEIERRVMPGCDHAALLASIFRKLQAATVGEAVYRFAAIRSQDFLPPASFEVGSA